MKFNKQDKNVILSISMDGNVCVNNLSQTDEDEILETLLAVD